MAALSRVMLPGSVAVWAVGMALSRLSIGAYGLINGLNVFWWIGLMGAVLGLMLAIQRRASESLLSAYVILIVLMISTTGLILEGGPRFPYVFSSLSYSANVLASGKIDYGTTYLSWPGWHIFVACLLGTTRIDPSVLVTWLPLWLTVVGASSLVFLLGRLRMPFEQRWLAAGLWAATAAMPAYPLPQTVAIILFLTCCALVADEYLGQARSVRTTLGAIVLALGLIITHLLTSVALVLVLSAISVLVMRTKGRRPGGIAVLVGIALAAYLFYVAISVTLSQLPNVVHDVLHLDELVGSIFALTSKGVGGGSAEHTRVVLIRMAYIAVIPALALAGTWFAARSRLAPRRWLVGWSWAIAGLATLTLGSYNGEILGRASVLALPGALALATWLWRSRRARGPIVVLMLVCVAFSPINVYGDEQFDYVRPSEELTDRVLIEFHPSDWALARPSRTWYVPSGEGRGAVSVVVYGPLMEQVSSFVRAVDRPEMLSWSYDNGDLRIQVSSVLPR